MKTHNIELMFATYDKTASDTDRAAQVQTLMDNVREDEDTDVKLKRSVIAKLATLKDADGVRIYKSMPKSSTKSGKVTVQKSDIVEDMARIVKCDASLIESFSNSTKAALEVFMGALLVTIKQAESSTAETIMNTLVEETEAQNVPTANA